MEKRLKAFVNRIEKENFSVEAVLWADREKVLFEHHFKKDEPRNIYSHTKSFTAAFVGMAVDRGKLKLSDKPAEFFPEKIPKNADPLLYKITLEDLLTMSSGLDGAFLMMPYRGQGEGGEDYISYLFSRPFSDEPGSRFLYSNGDTYLAGRMAEKALGKPMEKVLEENLFKPMKMENCPKWEKDPQGHVFGASGLCFKIRDMNMLGVLYLNEGMWQGQRILSREFIEEAGKKRISTHENSGPLDWHSGYGFQCWKLPYGKAYRFDGAHGQFSCIFPEKNMVIGVQSKEGTDVKRLSRMMHEELFFDFC